MTTRSGLVAVWIVAALLGMSGPVDAQTVTERGFVDARGFFFPDDAPNDGQNTVGDFFAREEAFLKPAPWIQFAAGVDLRGNTHDQVEHAWRLDFRDRGILQPRLSVRRLGATIAHGPITVDLGKQFIRWGKTDIVTPTDRFAPRDFMNVVENDFLAVSGARAVVQVNADTIDAVWVPWLTPSRTPLLNERWTVVPPGPVPVSLIDNGSVIPRGSQTGLRWSHTAAGYEYSASFFNGFNNLPNIDARPELPPNGSAPIRVDVLREYPSLRMYGGDVAVPTMWFTIKGEAGYFTTSSAATDEYALYVVQLERQTGEWLFVGGYAGQTVTKQQATATFAPDRGLTRSILGRASYTIDPDRSVAIEAAVRQNGRGAYTKGEYSQARGDHWRATITAALIRGDADDFLGQYRLNSHVIVELRYSF